MPHLVVSYAKPLEQKVDIQKLSQEIWDGAEESGLFSAGAIKVRALPVEHFVTGGTDQLFVHVDFKLFIGRTDEQKKHMNQIVFDRIAAMVDDDVAISVLPIDMDKENYLKR